MYLLEQRKDRVMTHTRNAQAREMQKSQTTAERIIRVRAQHDYVPSESALTAALNRSPGHHQVAPISKKEGRDSVQAKDKL